MNSHNFFSKESRFPDSNWGQKPATGFMYIKRPKRNFPQSKKHYGSECHECEKMMPNAEEGAICNNNGVTYKKLNNEWVRFDGEMETVVVMGYQNKGNRSSDTWGYASFGLGLTGLFLEHSIATFRVTNGAYNSSRFSPKMYPSGWIGGSAARITTYKVSSLSPWAKWGSFGTAIIQGRYIYLDKDKNPFWLFDLATTGLSLSTIGMFTVPVTASVVKPMITEAAHGTVKINNALSFNITNKNTGGFWQNIFKFYQMVKYRYERF